ncbi:MAG TPA: 5'/3'-nucleotidase SurE [Hyphomicrobiales bacterium]|nr:5'/3'-nucleotidase SurE [Hyphomicrobiales bacterium]
MRILVTNDDGIYAPGLSTLENIARALSDDVWVVAPETDQTGAAHSLSLNDPLRVREVADHHYAVRGTPTDCVIMAVRNIITGARPDLVLSGVNRGSNIADDVTYSGTVAAAIEGTILGIPSMALSQTYTFGESDVPWETAEKLAPNLVRRLFERGFPRNVFLNLNFPNLAPDEVRGTAITRQGKRDPGLMQIAERRDGRGNPYYWIAFERKRSDPPEGTDLWAIYEGMVSVTPLTVDLTHMESCERLAAALEEKTG